MLSLNNRKRYLLFILFLTLLSIIVLYDSRGELPIKEAKVEGITLTPRDAIFGIRFVDPLKGWAFGKFGLILHTENGGRTWKPQGNIKADLFGGDFMDEKRGCLVGRDGTIFATGDGGKNWERIDSGTDTILYDVEFLDENLGFAVGEFSTLLRTMDGGKSWGKITINWQKLSSKLMREIGGVTPHFFDVIFIDRNFGWISGEFGLILFTKDGGNSWTVQRGDSADPQIFRILFLNSKEGWAIGQDGFILKTEDQGRNWHIKGFSNFKSHLFDISIQGKRGIMVGEFLVLSTKDGGKSWQPVEKLRGFPWFTAVAKVGDKRFILAGKEGKILLLDGE